MSTNILRRSTAIILLLSGLLPPFAAASDVDVSAGVVRDFVVTAYYSPLPGQCCYVTGSEASDKRLNGEGLVAADGTPVYPGMIAAPSAYPFGTKIALEGLGVGVVHDRGGAIQVLGGDVHRLDLWVGSGEEGLARALAFGKRTVRGTILATGQGAATLAVEDLPANLSLLKPYDIHRNSLVGVRVQNGDVSLSVKRLQTTLQSLGYFDHEITGKFGLVTADALGAFQHDAGIDAPVDHLTDRTAATIEAFIRRQDDAIGFASIDRDSAGDDILSAKRVLRFLGFYRGRTTATYDDALFSAILAFQQGHGLVGDETSPGAGRIGPKTLPLLTRSWHLELAKNDAEQRLLAETVRQRLLARGALLSERLSEGSKGGQTSLLQHLLAGLGFFPADRQTGTFGPVTSEALAKFQVDQGLIDSTADPAAGSIGPETLAAIQRLQLKEALATVRSYGLSAL